MRRFREIWVDFNAVDESGFVLTLTKFAEPDVDISPGSSVVAGDDDGNVCKAQVVDVNQDGVVKLSLGQGTFEPADDLAEAMR
jgi:hypothetical protein